MDIGEVSGGGLSPPLGGKLSDRYNSDSVMWLMTVLCLLSCSVGFGLRETGPRVLAN